MTFFLLAVVIGLNRFTPLKDHLPFYLLSIGIMLLTAVIVFWIMIPGLQSKSNQVFLMRTFAGFSLKIFVGMTVLLSYFLSQKPADPYYVIIFFLIYLSYSGVIAFDLRRAGIEIKKKRALS